jgi:hypothetical protein
MRRSSSKTLSSSTLTTDDDFAAWEAAMVKEHEKDCANARENFASVPARSKEASKEEAVASVPTTASGNGRPCQVQG